MLTASHSPYIPARPHRTTTSCTSATFAATQRKSAQYALDCLPPEWLWPRTKTPIPMWASRRWTRMGTAARSPGTPEAGPDGLPELVSQHPCQEPGVVNGVPTADVVHQQVDRPAALVQRHDPWNPLGQFRGLVVVRVPLRRAHPRLLP